MISLYSSSLSIVVHLILGINRPLVEFLKFPLCSPKCPSLPFTNLILAGSRISWRFSSFPLTLLMWWPSYPDTLPVSRNSLSSAAVQGRVPLPVFLTSSASYCHAFSTAYLRSVSSVVPATDESPPSDGGTNTVNTPIAIYPGTAAGIEAPAITEPLQT